MEFLLNHLKPVRDLVIGVVVVTILLCCSVSPLLEG